MVGRLAEYRYREDVTQEVLYHEDVVVVCRQHHDMARRDTVTLEDLVTCNWILPPLETTLRRQIDKVFLDRGVPAPSNPVECVSFLTGRSLLLATDMLGVFPRHVMQREISSGQLAIVKCDLNLSQSPVGVSYRRENALSPAASAFLSELRKVSCEPIFQ